MSWSVRVLPDRYADSVRLMGVARTLRERDGVDACEVVMGTAANLDALRALGADAPGARPVDVVIAVRCDDDGGAAGEQALDAVERELAAPAGEDAASALAQALPRSLPGAAARLPGANVALISVPGEYATLAAHQALDRGLSAFLFSDHVPVADELALKRRGAARGLLVMGPDCGTAMLGGVGLGFANVVARGPVGVVAASGTGAQEAACLLDAAGSGVSQLIGVGGRDLSAAVGGLMTRAALRRLAADDETETILLVSKPPAAAVVRTLADSLPAGKRVVGAFVGDDGSAAASASFAVHPTIEGAAYDAAGADPPSLEALGRAVDARRLCSAGTPVLGLYSGGSLAHEAASTLAAALGPIGGNLGDAAESDGPDEPRRNVVLDLGAEEYTQGRPHPMVDPTTRVRLLAQAAAEARVGCVLLDVVLGHGAHPDPASALTDPIARVGRRATVLVRVCGTRADPQDADRQTSALERAGALVAPSNAAVARLAVRAVGGGG